MKTKAMTYKQQCELILSIIQHNTEYCKCEEEKNVFGFNDRLICGICFKPLGIIKH